MSAGNDEALRHERVLARYADSPPALDGRLDDAVWRAARAYPLDVPRVLAAGGATLQEAGEVRFAWDERNFCAAARLSDSDLVAEGPDGAPAYHELGDVFELFLKPRQATWYWEFHVTPLNQRAAMFHPGRGRIGLRGNYGAGVAFQSAVRCAGTVNDWRDRDDEWTVAAAIPFEALSRDGVRFGPGHDWCVLAGRYNFSRYLATRGPELSSFPQVPAVDFHRHEEYAVIEWVKKPNADG